MDSPVFCVIIPVFNTPAEYFQKCVDSLTGQTMSDFEIILVDDGSKEECANLCDRMARMDSRIRVIHQVNQGVSAARNRGIEEACAPWIIFVDADDWLELNAFEKLKEKLSNRDCDILLFNLIKEYAQKKERQNYGFEDGVLYDLSEPAVRERFYRRAMHPPVLNGQRLCTVYYSCDKVFKREFLINHDLRYPVGIPKSEDKVFILNCFEKLRKLYYIDDVFYHYRMNEGSACHRFTVTADADCAKLAQKLFVIAQRMDAEMAELTGNAQYDQITRDCYRFLFGIISDVLFLKYYHSGNPQNRKERNDAAREFLRAEPFQSAILRCEFSELSMEAKLKKLLLQRGQPGLFCYIKQFYLYLKGQRS